MTEGCRPEPFTRQQALGRLAALGLLLAAPARAEPGRDVIADAVARLRQEISYARHAAARFGLELRAEQVAALAVMSYVQGRVSAPVYGYRRELARLPIPGGDSGRAVAVASLETEAGICGHAAWTFVILITQLAVEARTVHIYFEGGSHAAAEVRWGARWHFYDPTWGTFYERRGAVLSLGEVLELSRPAAFAVTNESLLWRQITRNPAAARATGRAFLSHADIRVEDADGGELYRRTRSRPHG